MINIKLFANKKTILNINTNLKTNKRFYPGPEKNVVKEIAKKCIGAGCDNTIPFAQQRNNVKLNLPKENAQISPTKTREKDVKTSDEDLNTEQRRKQIRDPIKSTTDKVTESLKKPTITSKMQRLAENSTYMEERENKHLDNNTLEIPEKIRMHLKDPMKAFVVRENESNIDRPSVLEKISSKELMQQESAGPEDFVIAVRLNENVMGDTKHVNFCEYNKEGTKAVSYGVGTSSEDHDKNTGKSTSIKLSSIKMDNSFIKKAVIIPIEKKEGHEPDFIAGFAISENTSGQRMRVFETPREYSSSEYKVSPLGMNYLENNPEAEKKVKAIIALKKAEMMQKENDVD